MNGEVPLDVQANLARGVANMEVDAKAPTGPDQPAPSHPGKVFGLDSFASSSEGMEMDQVVEQMSMRDSLMLVKKQK